jgi:hypothetical protein
MFPFTSIGYCLLVLQFYIGKYATTSSRKTTQQEARQRNFPNIDLPPPPPPHKAYVRQLVRQQPAQQQLTADGWAATV